MKHHAIDQRVCGGVQAPKLAITSACLYLVVKPAGVAVRSVEDNRKQAEREFHNKRFGDEPDVRAPLGKWYDAISNGTSQHIKIIKKLARHSDVLEYGCGDGRLSVEEETIVSLSKTFVGIDISEHAVARANDLAAEHGLKNCQFIQMDAEDMNFPDGRFDLIFGRGIIHHLNLEAAYAELSRVLRPGGTVVFFEPMGHNVLINIFRSRTPDMRTVDEHPLLMSDLNFAKLYFNKVSVQFYGLTTIAAVPFGRGIFGRTAMAICRVIDQILLSIPGVRQNAWHVLLSLQK